MKKKILFSIIYFGIIPAYSQNLQSNQAKPNSSDTTQTVTITAKSFDSERDDSASKSVFKSDFLNELGTMNLIDAFARIPSVNIVDGVPQLRGIKGGTQILVDGQKMPAGFSLGNLDTKMIDRIEVFRLATAEFSSQAMGGTINIVLRNGVIRSETALNYNLNKKIGANHEAGVAWSSKEGLFSQNTRLNLRSGRSDFDSGQQDIYDMQRDSNGRVVQSREGISNGETHVQSINLTPRLTWRKVGDDFIIVNSNLGYRENTKNQLDDFRTFVGTPFPFGHINQRVVTKSSSGSSTLRMSHRVNDTSKFDIDLSLSGERTHSNLRSNDTDEDRIHKSFRSVQAESTERGYTSSLKYRSTINDNHEFVSGLSISNMLKLDRRHFLQSDPRPSLSFSTDDNTNVDILNSAGFAQDEWQLNKLDSIYAGLRWEGISINSDSNMAKSAYRSSVWSPILQGLMKFKNKQDQLRFGVGRTYKAPSDFMVLTPKEINRNNSELTPNFQGNPNLKPSLTWNIESAFEHNEQDLSYAARFYFKSISGVHLLSTSLINDEWTSRYINGGDAHARGIEIDFRTTAKKFFEDAPKIGIRASFARRWSSISSVKGENNRIERFPETLNFSIDYAPKDLPIKFGSSFRLAKGGWQDTESNKREYVRPVTSTDLFANWQPSDRTSIRFGYSKYVMNRFEYLSEFNGVNVLSSSKKSNPAIATWSVTLEHTL